MTRKITLRIYIRSNVVFLIVFLIVSIAVAGQSEISGPTQLSEDLQAFFIPKASPISSVRQTPTIDSPLPVSFASAVTYDSGGEVTRWAAIADVNGDDKSDVVVANEQSNTIGVLLGNGD